MAAFLARLPKKERLKNLGLIQYLFSGTNEKVGKYPLLLFYGVKPQDKIESNVQVLFSVSKKKFPRAVDRNRVKRLMREAYRKQGFSSIQPKNKEQLLLAIVYTGRTIVSYDEVEKSMIALYDVLTKRFS